VFVYWNCCSFKWLVHQIVLSVRSSFWAVLDSYVQVMMPYIWFKSSSPLWPLVCVASSSVKRSWSPVVWACFFILVHVSSEACSLLLAWQLVYLGPTERWFTSLVPYYNHSAWPCGIVPLFLYCIILYLADQSGLAQDMYSTWRSHAIR